MSLSRSTELGNLIPSEFHLSQNYPNPFSERTTIKLCVACKTRVKVEVFSSGGRLLGALLDEEKEPGTYEVQFDASHMPGGEQDLTNGSYVYRLRAGDFSEEKRMILLREQTSPCAHLTW